ncbi:Structural maintenance of chromosomes protein 5 [Thecaphora frezii]
MSLSQAIDFRRTSQRASASTQLSLKAEHLSQVSSIHLDSSVPTQPTAQKRLRRSQVESFQGDEDTEGEREEEDPDEEQAARPRTRQRTLPSASASGLHLGDAQHSTHPQASTCDNGQLAALSQRSSDGFLPGSIRRVALYQFVTYDFVEFHPGPNLNMIIGPNGTGKSTIASGIALGLGWSTSVLSRQKDLADFVKNDCQEGWIELELQGLPGQRNIVIRRTLVKTDNTSDWFLNGHKSSKREVTERVGEFEIDISNLCSFLPQDKVAAFARMSPQEVLVETEKMAGDPRLFKWHSKLEELGRALAIKEAALEHDVKQRDNLQERNEALERDVRRFEEREKMEKNIFNLKVKILKAKYSIAVAEAKELQAEKREKKRQLREAEEAGKPMKAKKRELDRKIEETEERLQEQRDAMRTEEKKASRLIRELEQRGADIERLHDKMRHLKTTEEDRKRTIRDLRAEIARREEIVNAGPPEVDLTEIKLQIRSVDQEDRQVQDELSQISNDKNQISIESKSQNRSRDDLKRRLDSLEDVKAQRLEKLRQADAAAFSAVNWLRNNQAMFQKPVYEPILLEINVTDPAYADAVESCINWPLMKTFICQTRADYDLFTREVIDQRRMRVTVAEVESMNLENFRPPAPADQLQTMGFDKYVLDVLTGPRDVLTHLCNTAHLHGIPIARNDQNINVEQVENARLFRRFIIGNTSFTVSYSSYGNRSAQTASRVVTPARTLARSIDGKVQKQLEDQMQVIHQKVKELEAEMGPLLRRESKLRKQRETISQRRAELLAEKREKENVRSSWEKAKVDLDRLKKRLMGEEQRPSVEAQRLRCLEERRVLVHKRAQLAQDLKRVMQEMTRVHPQADITSFSKMQLEANARLVERLYEEHRATLNELIDEKAEADKRVEAALQRVKRLSEKAEELSDSMPGFVIDPDTEVSPS